MTPGLTTNRYVAFSPGRVNENGSDEGIDVQPAGSFSVIWPALPWIALLTRSTRTRTLLSRIESGTIAWRGATLTATAGRTASSRVTEPYGSCASRRLTGV